MPLITVEFCIISDSINPESITKLLGILPTRTRRKNEWPRPSIEAGMACNQWEIQTEQESSKSVDGMCKKIIDKLRGREEHIQSLWNDYNVEIHFEVVIHMKSTETPVIYLEKESIKFLVSINTDIGFDVYAYEGNECDNLC